MFNLNFKTMYKEASKQKLRIATSKGLLSVEQLWDLQVEELDKVAVALEEEYKNSKGKSFLVKKTTKDKTVKLKFDIVLDILTSKVEEAEQAREAIEIKEYNQKILELISKKKESELEGKSISELMKMLK
jgi:hypothetical protein